MPVADDLTWDDIKRMLAELIAQSRETERQMQETDRRMQETDRRMQETDRRMQETDRRMQETDRRMRELQRQIGKLGNRLGDFIEDMVLPAVVRLFQERGVPVHRVIHRLTARDESGQLLLEIDLLVSDHTHAVGVECKSRLTTDDVDEHLRHLGRFKEVFPEYADKVLHGAVAAMGIPEEVARYAERQGLYVLVQADDDIVVRNAPGFVPRSW